MVIGKKRACGIWLCLFAACLVYAESPAEEEIVEEEAVESVSGMDPYTGWSYAPADKVDVTSGHVRLVLDGKKGTMGLYAVNEDGKKGTALFSPYDSFGTSYYSLRIGRNEYPFNPRSSALREVRETACGGQVAWTVPDKAYFVADYSFPESTGADAACDVLRVTLYTVNTGKTAQSFEVKGIFNTLLGETAGIHFTTDKSQKVKTQQQFTQMSEEKWVCSANGKAAVKLLLDGADITKPQYVTLAPRDMLSRNWLPSVREGKSFTSLFSYNDSGVAVNWKTVYLQPQEMSTITFYISVAEGVEPVYAGRKPADKDFLAAVSAGTCTYRTDMGGRTVPVKAAAQEAELSPAAQAVTAEQLDPEYIQNLIDYIESIENGEDIDEAELKGLNDELDAIFEKLRSLED